MRSIQEVKTPLAFTGRHVIAHVWKYAISIPKKGHNQCWSSTLWARLAGSHISKTPLSSACRLTVCLILCVVTSFLILLTVNLVPWPVRGEAQFISFCPTAYIRRITSEWQHPGQEAPTPMISAPFMTSILHSACYTQPWVCLTSFISFSFWSFILHNESNLLVVCLFF